MLAASDFMFANDTTIMIGSLVGMKGTKSCLVREVLFTDVLKLHRA